jgi:hypothetical protein
MGHINRVDNRPVTRSGMQGCRRRVPSWCTTSVHLHKGSEAGRGCEAGVGESDTEEGRVIMVRVREGGVGCVAAAEVVRHLYT